jgi:hypothetical protein
MTFKKKSSSKKKASLQRRDCKGCKQYFASKGSKWCWKCEPPTALAILYSQHCAKGGSGALAAAAAAKTHAATATKEFHAGQCGCHTCNVSLLVKGSPMVCSAVGTGGQVPNVSNGKPVLKEAPVPVVKFSDNTRQRAMRYETVVETVNEDEDDDASFVSANEDMQDGEDAEMELGSVGSSNSSNGPTASSGASMSDDAQPACCCNCRRCDVGDMAQEDEFGAVPVVYHLQLEEYAIPTTRHHWKYCKINFAEHEVENGVATVPLCHLCAQYLNDDEQHDRWSTANKRKAVLKCVWPVIVWIWLLTYELEAWRLIPSQWREWWHDSLLVEKPHLGELLDVAPVFEDVTMKV